MTDIDTRVSPSFHPAVFGESDDPLIQQAAAKFENAYTALSRLHSAREEAMASPLLTKEAAVLKVADLANKSSEGVTKNLDAARKILEGGVNAIENTFNQPFTDNGSGINAEIRNHVRSLPTEEKHSFIRAAIEQKDLTTLRAVLGGPAYLSGLTVDSQKAYTNEANKVHDPAQYARLQALQKALARVDGISILLVNNEVEKGLGTNWKEIKKLREKQSRLEKAFT